MKQRQGTKFGEKTRAFVRGHVELLCEDMLNTTCYIRHVAWDKWQHLKEKLKHWAVSEGANERRVQDRVVQEFLRVETVPAMCVCLCVCMCMICICAYA